MSDSITTTEPDSDILRAEQARVGLITAAFDGCQFSNDAARHQAEVLKSEAVLANESPDVFRSKLLNFVRASRPSGPAIHGGKHVSSAAALEAALLCHMGHERVGEKTLGADAMQQGRELRCGSLMDILKACLTLEGRDIPAGRDGVIRAAFSTVSVPGILSNAAGKILENAYTAFPSVARLIARRLSAKDFKTHTGYRLTGDAKFEEVGDGGELKHGHLTESSFAFKVSTYGKIFGLTRQSVVNDDLSAFDEVPRMLGRGAALALEELFWTLVLANTGTFFGEAHANLIDGADSALGLDSLGEAVATMLKVTDSDGHPINVIPRYLVVPPELKATADSLYRSTTVVVAGGGETAQRLPGANAFFGLYEPATTPYLSNDNYPNASELGWYLFGDPNDVAAFGIAYLNGQETPVIEQVDAGPEVLGISWRGYLDFGVCQVDHRGGVMSAGE